MSFVERFIILYIWESPPLEGSLYPYFALDFVDMYSFDVDKQAAMESYHLVQEAYGRIFQQLEQPIVEGSHF